LQAQFNRIPLLDKEATGFAKVNMIAEDIRHGSGLVLVEPTVYECSCLLTLHGRLPYFFL